MKIFKTVVKWYLGLSAIIAGIVFCSTSIIAGVLVMLAGLLILPPSLHFIEKKIGKTFSRSVKYGGAFLLLVIAVFFSGINSSEESERLAAEEKERKQQEFAALPKEKQDSILFAKALADSLEVVNAAKRAEVERAHKEAAERKEKIETSFSPYDGSHRGLEKLVKRNMNDPDSYDHVETNYWDMGDHLVVLMQYRGNNAFGGKVLGSTKAKVDLEGNVLEIID